jgi:integrase
MLRPNVSGRSSQPIKLAYRSAESRAPPRRNLSANSLAAYERTWTRFLAWTAAAGFDPRSLPFPTALDTYPFLGEGKNAASLKQIRAALSFAYKHWDLKNPFAKIEPPLHKEPQIRYLLLSDIRRLLAYLKTRQNGYVSALGLHLANALFQTACRFEELIQLTWSDCQRGGNRRSPDQGQGKRLPGCARSRPLECSAPRVEGPPGEI